MSIYQLAPVQIYLTNRFHVALCLFSNRSHVTSKYGKSKKVPYEPLDEGITDVLTTFWHPWLIIEQMHARCNLFVLYNEEVKTLNCDVISACVLQ